MSTRPKAHELADALETPSLGTRQTLDNAAAELRRLHAANVDCVNHFNAIKAERDELLAALDKLVKAVEWGQVKPVHNLCTLGRALAKSKKTIAKVTS